MNSFNPQEPEDNLPKLQIFRDECPVLINAIKAASYDKPKGNKPAEDIAEFDGDDPIDGLRYLVNAANELLGDAEQEFKKVEIQDALLKKVNQDGDWTAFYRNAAKLEERSSVDIQPLSRYKRRR